ncbi:hypothetical protein KUTeg_004000 [Tegillarca granosa]|uniref:PDZ domain-containing protein n=1 Tax=Tegillarca granosa TaxID=220873 RepID=A0ABQ9FNR0_TEGGR|nr:hypothetical protein KUTeg_004000 [Tegillarca granosa]
MSNLEYVPPEKLIIQLSRPDSSVSWGFRLQGGSDFSTPLSVQSVQPNSVAECSGLQAGDGLLAINNFATDSMSHENAKMEIIRSGNEISLLIQSLDLDERQLGQKMTGTYQVLENEGEGQNENEAVENTHESTFESEDPLNNSY